MRMPCANTPAELLRDTIFRQAEAVESVPPSDREICAFFRKNGDVQDVLQEVLELGSDVSDTGFLADGEERRKEICRRLRLLADSIRECAEEM